MYVFVLFILPFLPFAHADCSSTAEQLWVRDLLKNPIHSNCLERGSKPVLFALQADLYNQSATVAQALWIGNVSKVATRGRFEPAILRLQGIEHTATSRRPS